MFGQQGKHGGPLSFQCWKCRRARMYDNPRKWNYGTADKVELTGRKKNNKIMEPQRADTHKREYKCNDCGHVGWSCHTDLKWKENAEKKRAENNS